MSHPITKSLQKLDPPLSANATITFYLEVAGPPGKSFSKHHGVGIVVDVEKRLDVKNIKFPSDSDPSTDMRGALGGVLTVLEWLALNNAESSNVTVYTGASYVHQSLKNGIKKWLKDPRRPNRDLLTKIDPLLDRFHQISLYPAADAADIESRAVAIELAAEARDAANSGSA